MSQVFIECKEYLKRDKGRVHTSAATVAVLPEVEEVDIEKKSPIWGRCIGQADLEDNP